MTRRPEEGTYSTIGSGGNRIDREGSLNWAPIYDREDIGLDFTSCFDSRSQGDAIYILPTSSFCTGSCHSILYMSADSGLDLQGQKYERAHMSKP